MANCNVSLDDQGWGIRFSWPCYGCKIMAATGKRVELYDSLYIVFGIRFHIHWLCTRELDVYRWLLSLSLSLFRLHKLSSRFCSHPVLQKVVDWKLYLRGHSLLSLSLSCVGAQVRLTIKLLLMRFALKPTLFDQN